MKEFWKANWGKIAIVILSLSLFVGSAKADDKLTSKEFNMLKVEVDDIKKRLDEIEKKLEIKHAQKEHVVVQEVPVYNKVYSYEEGSSLAKRFGKRLVTFIKTRPRLLPNVFVAHVPTFSTNQETLDSWQEYNEPTITVSEFVDGEHYRLNKFNGLATDETILQTVNYKSPPGFHRHMLPDGTVFEHNDANFGSAPAHQGLPWPWPKYNGPLAPVQNCPSSRCPGW